MGQEEQEKISKVALVTMAIILDIIACSLIVGGAWIINKVIFAPLLIIVFRLVRVRIERQYKILHFGTMTACILASFILCFISLALSLPTHISLIFYVLSGAVIGYLTWVIDGHIERHFINKKQNLEIKLKQLNLSDRDYAICKMYYVDKRKPRDIHDWLWDEGYTLEYDSMRKVYSKIKNKIK